MTEFKVGDKIRVLVNYYVGCMPNGDGPKVGDVLEVVDKNKCTTPGNWIDKYTAEVDQVNLYGNTEFALVEKLKPRFAVGDKVISIKNTPAVPEGFIGYIVEDKLLEHLGKYDYAVRQQFTHGFVEYFKEDELELLSVSNVKLKRDDVRPEDIQGIVKPDVINSPKHYSVFESVEAIQVIASSMTQDQFYGYCLGNILKYRLRAGGKDDVMQELGKADKYQELYTEHKHLCKEGK